MITKTLRSPWLDRFNEPSTDGVIEAIEPEQRHLFDHIRDRINALTDVSERLEWQGLPWRWALAFSSPKCPQDRALAYLIPDPDAARLAVALGEDAVPSLLGPRSARCLRENIAHSSQVGSVIWTEWVLSSKVLADELVKLVAAKLEGPAKAKPRRTQKPASER